MTGDLGPLARVGNHYKVVVVFQRLAAFLGVKHIYSPTRIHPLKSELWPSVALDLLLRDWS